MMKLKAFSFLVLLVSATVLLGTSGEGDKLEDEEYQIKQPVHRAARIAQPGHMQGFTRLLKIRIENDIEMLYTPTDAPSRVEHQKRKLYEKIDLDSYTALVPANETELLKRPYHTEHLVLIYAGKKKGVNILGEHLSQRIINFDSHIRQDFKYTHHGQLYEFGKDFCRFKEVCHKVFPMAHLFFDLYFNEKIRNDKNEAKFTYPVMDIVGLQIYIANFIQGVTKDAETHEITGARVLNSYMDVPIENATMKKHLLSFRKSLTNFMDQTFNSKQNLSAYMFTPNTLNEELNKIIFIALPYVFLSFGVLIGFAFVSNYTNSDMTLEALAGVLSTTLSIPTTFGLVFYMGVPFNSMVVVTPFLIIAIGVDDAFILINAWKMSKKQQNSGDTYRSNLVRTLKEAGPGILLTSITDAASFGIGSISTTPAVQVFCIFTAVGIVIDFIYQITFFPAILVIGQKRRKDFTCFGKKLKIKKDKQKIPNNGSCTMENVLIHSVEQPWFKSFILTFYVVYLSISLYGCTKVKINLKTTKLLVDNSPFYSYFEILETDIWQERVEIAISVLRSPDFRKVEEQQKFLTMVEEIESLKYSSGKSSSQVWLREYLKYLPYFKHRTEDFYVHLREFQSLAVNSHLLLCCTWETSDNLTDPDVIPVKQFYINMNFHGAGTWPKRIELLQRIRSILNQHKEYDAVLTCYDSKFADQIDSIGATTMQTVGIALLAMGAIALVFLPQTEAAFWVFYSLISIDVGVIGLLSLWGADLDPMSMIDIVLSIGFSIDFTAHFCFQYYRPRNRKSMSNAISSIGWPLMQCGLSTLLAVAPLGFIGAYIARTFFRTVVLVVGLGLIHALVVLPVILSMLHRNNDQQSGFIVL